MPFYPLAIYAKNGDIIVNYVECKKPHFLFSIKKLSIKIKKCYKGF